MHTTIASLKLIKFFLSYHRNTLKGRLDDRFYLKISTGKSLVFDHIYNRIKKQRFWIALFHLTRSYFGGVAPFPSAIIRSSSSFNLSSGTAFNTSAIQNISSPQTKLLLNTSSSETLGIYSSTRCQYCVGSAFV